MKVCYWEIFLMMKVFVEGFYIGMEDVFWFEEVLWFFWVIYEGDLVLNDVRDDLCV